MSKEQCCGNCGFWREVADGVGSCLFPVVLPEAYWLESFKMEHNNGTTYPCWKPKEESDES